LRRKTGVDVLGYGVVCMVLRLASWYSSGQYRTNTSPHHITHYHTL